MSTNNLRRRILRHYRDLGRDCHLCGLPIPEWLVNPHHPLATTSDHVVPRSLGGPNHSRNRRPAHRCCNCYRGIRELGEELTAECRALSLGHFATINIPTGRRWRPVRRLLRKFNRQVGGCP